MVHPVLLLMQAALSIVIIGVIYGLHRHVGIEEVKFRLRFLVASFLAFLASLIFHAFAVSLLFEHVFEIVFFILLGATGLLHFMEKKYLRVVAAASYVLVGVLLLGSLAAQVYFSLVGISYHLGLRAIILAHTFQIALLLLVTGLILRRILITHSSLSPITLHRRYPFGVASALMMFAVAAHIINVSLASDFQHQTSFFESLFVLPALAIVAGYVIFAYKNQVYFFGPRDEKHARSLRERLNHVVRQVYYTPVDVGIGRREVLFSEFLESTGLRKVFKRQEMELDEEKFLRASEGYEFLHRLSKDILKFFTRYRELVNEAQFYHLVDFLDLVYARRPRGFDFKPQWLMLSELAKTLGVKAEQHLDKLSNWDNETTFSYFEEVHPTAIQAVDERLGGARTHQLLLNIVAEIPKLRILHPVIKSALHSWRNVIYVTSDPVVRIKRELEEESSYFGDRLRVITVLPGNRKREEGIVAVPSAQELAIAVEEGISAFPLGTLFLVLDLTPIVISSSPAGLHAFMKTLGEMRYNNKMVVCAAVSQNIPPLVMDILREDADIVASHELVSGALVSRILKPALGAERKAALSRELFEVLRFVYDENARGRKPAIGEISSALAITPKTAKKRVSMLESKGMIKLEKLGRYKVAEITERGRQVALAGASFS
jgi:DNA-binding MarR family transcriptional regulator